MTYKLLIAEDENKTRKALKTSIPWEELGIGAIEEASNGRKALEIAIAFRPDIVVTDIRMPELDGIELAKQLLELDGEIGIVIVSAYDDIPYLKSAIKVGAVDYIMKPVDVAELKMAVRTALGQRGASKDREKWVQILNRNLPLLQEEFFKSLLYTRVQNRSVSEKLEELQLDDLKDRKLYLFSITLSAEGTGEKPYKELHQDALSVIRRQTEGFDYSTAFFNASGDIHLIVAAPSACYDSSGAGAIAADVRNSVMEHCRLQASVIYCPDPLFLHELSKGYRQLREQAKPDHDGSGEETSTAESGDRDSRFMQAVKRYIAAHYGDNGLTIGDIAAHMRYTDAYVCMIFKKETGITLNHYLNIYRISKAKELLLSEVNYKMAEIADKIGYSNENYFSKVFRKYEGMSPSDFRESRAAP